MGFGQGRPERAGTCQAGVPQRWKFRVTSFDSQSVSRVMRPGPSLLSLRGLNPGGQGLGPLVLWPGFGEPSSSALSLAGLHIPRSLWKVSENPGHYYLLPSVVH